RLRGGRRRPSPRARWPRTVRLAPARASCERRHLLTARREEGQGEAREDRRVDVVDALELPTREESREERGDGAAEERRPGEEAERGRGVRGGDEEPADRVAEGERAARGEAEEHAERDHVRERRHEGHREHGERAPAQARRQRTRTGGAADG